MLSLLLVVMKFSLDDYHSRRDSKAIYFYFFLLLFFSIQDLSMATLSPFNCLLFLTSYLATSFANKNDLLITTNSGQVHGKILSVLDGEVRAFLGIPYGRPPVGDLRFRAPEPTDPWQGVKNATNYANSCFQMPDTKFQGRLNSMCINNSLCLQPNHISTDIQQKIMHPSLILFYSNILIYNIFVFR